MPAPTQHEIDTISAGISIDLSTTRYACSSLERLSGGTTSFVFRGQLKEPLREQNDIGSIQRTTIIAKTAEEFVALNRDFYLDASRAGFEAIMLKALHNFPITATSHHIVLRTPRLFYFNSKTNTQAIEDFHNTADLRSLLDAPPDKQFFVISIGQAIGSWLRSFHDWTASPAQCELRSETAKNEPMRKLKSRITYEAFLLVLQNFPKILEGSRESLEEAKAMAMRAFQMKIGDEGAEEWGIIHGDFWTGNILVPDLATLTAQNPDSPIPLAIIDWEFSQFGHRSIDLGQIIGDLYELYHYRGTETALWLIKGIVAGYDTLSEELAFKTAIHTGVHLICWYMRRDPNGPLGHPLEKVEAAMKIGVDFIVKGWKKDRKWFEGKGLESLFHQLR